MSIQPCRLSLALVAVASLLAVGVEPAAAQMTIRVCIVEDGQLREVRANYDPSSGDTTVGSQPFRRAHPSTTPPYAAGAVWYINNQPITHDGGTFVKYGLPRVLGTDEVAPVGSNDGVPVFAEAGTSAPRDVVYIPVRQGCEFQPYQREVSAEPIRSGSGGGDPDQWYLEGMEYYDDGEYARAFPLLERAADAGDARAQFRVGYMYNHGQGVEESEAEAAMYYRLAGEQGNASALNNLALAYEQGSGVRQDYDRAVEYYRRAAELNNATAMANLANMYRQGRGVARDSAEAVRWYRQAVERGNPRAANDLGLMYKHGRAGLPRDYDRALQLFNQAAAQDYSYALWNLGDMHENGLGVRKNCVLARRFFEKADEQGHPNAAAAVERLRDGC